MYPINRADRPIKTSQANLFLRIILVTVFQNING
jgi:hypothetical protein